MQAINYLPDIVAKRQPRAARASRGAAAKLPPHRGCRFTTYRHRFARVAPAPRAKLIIQRIVDALIIQRIVDARRPSTQGWQKWAATSGNKFSHFLPNVVRPCCREAAALRGARHAKRGGAAAQQPRRAPPDFKNISKINF